MRLIDRIILLALALFAIYLGYHFIEVKADSAANPIDTIDTGLLLTALGGGLLILSLIPNPRQGR